MRYNKGDVIQEGRLKGCKVLDFYFEREMPYKSWYDVEYREGKHRKFDALDVEPNNMLYSKQCHSEFIVNSRDEYDNVVNVRIFDTRDKVFSKESYSYSNSKKLPLKEGSYVTVPLRQRDKQMHLVPAEVVEINVKEEDIKYAEEQAHLHKLSNVYGMIHTIYGLNSKEAQNEN